MFRTVLSVKVPEDIDDLFDDAKRGRLDATCGAGFLAVLERKRADRCEVVELLPTGKLAHTCLFDERSGRLYVPVPRQKGKDGSSLLVFQPRP